MGRTEGRRISSLVVSSFVIALPRASYASMNAEISSSDNISMQLVPSGSAGPNVEAMITYHALWWLAPRWQATVVPGLECRLASEGTLSGLGWRPGAKELERLRAVADVTVQSIFRDISY